MVAGILDLGLLQHLPDDHLDMLVVDGHALEPVHLLDLVDQIVGELLDALDRQDVVRRRMAIEQELALLDAVALLHGKMPALGDQILDRLLAVIVGHDGDAPLVLVVAAELHRAGDFGDDGVILGTPRLEQLRHPRQTAGDVARLGALHRDTGEHVAGAHLMARARPTGSHPPAGGSGPRRRAASLRILPFLSLIATAGRDRRRAGWRASR